MSGDEPGDVDEPDFIGRRDDRDRRKSLPRRTTTCGFLAGSQECRIPARRPAT